MQMIPLNYPSATNKPINLAPTCDRRGAFQGAVL